MTDIKDTTFEDIVSAVAKANQVIEDMEAEAKVLKDELLDRLKAEKITGKKAGKWFVTRVRRLSATDVSMETAKELGAVKMTINQDVIKNLVNKGVKIVGVKWSEFVTIREEVSKSVKQPEAVAKEVTT